MRRATKPLHVQNKRISASMVNGLREMSNLPSLPKFALRLRIFSNRRRPEVLAEDVFRRIFCWERKRAERSGRCFLLMLVHVESILQANQSERALSEIVSALSSSTRDTDLAGWYREGAILGVIFTEVREGNCRGLASLTPAKVIASLRSKLSPGQLDQIHISFHSFPENWDKSSLGRLANATLYPDLFERDEARKLSRFVNRSMECGNDARIHREYVRRFISGEADPARISNTEDVVYKIQDDPRVTRIG